MNHCGGLAPTPLPSRPWKRMSYWKMWVSSCMTSSNSSPSGRSTGSTIRLRTGLAKAPMPSGMKLRMMLFCSNAEWVA